jgi:uncharacterized membrane protein YdjX (TVP38/TMEM64 family)
MPFSSATVFRAIILVALLAGLLALQYFFDIASYFETERIKAWLAEAGAFAPLALMLAMAAAVVISPIPSLPLDIAAGAFFGPWLGTLYAATGATAGAVASFVIARLLGRKILERFLSGHINFCDRCSNRLLTKIVLVSRLMPFVSFDIVSYGAGLTKIGIKHFAAATFIGMLPWTFAYNYFGAVLVINRWTALGIGLLMVLLFFLIPRWIERFDPFSMRKYFQHGHAPDSGNSRD